MTTELWTEPRIDVKVSRPENARVREIYLKEKARWLLDHYPVAELTGGNPAGCKCRRCGKFRGDLAREWVAVAEKANLYVPGTEARKPLRPGETEHDRRVDAARTRIRNFEKGTDQRGWVVTGIETTICDRRGMSYPGAAYSTQERLFND